MGSIRKNINSIFNLVCMACTHQVNITPVSEVVNSITAIRKSCLVKAADCLTKVTY